jgi:hypothetical protein
MATPTLEEGENVIIVGAFTEEGAKKLIPGTKVTIGGPVVFLEIRLAPGSCSFGT